MPIKTWYLTDNSVSVGSDMSETDSPTESYRSPTTGWVVSTGSTNNSAWFNDTERAATTFVNTTPPSGTLDTTNGDFWITDARYTGRFDSGNWTVSLTVRAQTNGGAQDGRMICRLFRSPNRDGAGATEITAAQQLGSLVTDLTTATSQTSSATFNPGSFTVSAEFIIVQLAWQRTGAGGMTNSDVNARDGGNSSKVTSANFTELRIRQSSSFMS